MDDQTKVEVEVEVDETNDDQTKYDGGPIPQTGDETAEEQETDAARSDQV
jgi:hypothetical protein